MGNTAKQCRLGLFQDSDFAGDLEDSKSTSGGTLCIFGSHTFVPKSWMCKKQTAVSHSSTESEIISLDTGLRLDGLPALELWDLIVSVLGNVSRVSDRSGQLDSDVLSKTTPTCSLLLFEMTMFKNSILSGTEYYLSLTKIPHDDILEGLYKLRARESEKLRTVLELYDLETHQKKLGPDYHRLKAMVKRSVEQEIRNKNFEARSGNFEKNAVVKNPGDKTAGTTSSWRLLAMGSQRAMCERGQLQFPPRYG